MKQIDPDEIFLDTYNLPSFDRQQFEGQMDRPIAKTTVYVLSIIFCLFGFIFLGRLVDLQVVRGEALAERSELNTLHQTVVFPERGIIYDRNGVELAWNRPERAYLDKPGLAHVLGYLGRQTEIDQELYNYSPGELVGRDGAERVYNRQLAGEKGIKVEEIDALGAVYSEYLYRTPKVGTSLRLSIDSELQSKLFEYIRSVATSRGFVGGAGVILDVHTGELLALTNYPEFDPVVMSRGKDVSMIEKWIRDENKPFLNRAITGLYTPGSIIKPIVATAALSEGIISPDKQILSTGELVVPNPYNPDLPSIFKDWKAHGWVDLRHALAVSSNVYFYVIGGGFGDQVGLGINRLERYARGFGLGAPTGMNWTVEAKGVIPNPEWKKEFFDDDVWRLGDTYHTSIGQYGFQVTPLQMARAVAAIANGGWLVTPTVLSASDPELTPLLPKPRPLESWILRDALGIVREGMRLAVTEGTAGGLNISSLAIGAKTGTAELGFTKAKVTSWVTGFFPYDNPRYAFVVTMERGPSSNGIGGVYVMRQFFDWLGVNHPEYIN